MQNPTDPIVRVIINKPVDLPLLDYQCSDAVKIGSPVKVPLGVNNRLTSAYVADFSERDVNIQYKSVACTDEEKPQLPQSLMQVLLFAAQYYRYSPSLMLSAALPLSARNQKKRYWLNPEIEPEEILVWAKKYKQGFTTKTLAKYLEISQAQATKRAENYLQRNIFIVKQIKKRVVKKQVKEVALLNEQKDEQRKLTQEQLQALELLEPLLQQQKFAVQLLHGVTGSGKTEIYLQVIARILEQNKTALMLVPEIALTPQLGARFVERFGEHVVIFHSGLTPAQKQQAYERVLKQEASIALGARSAIFLPLQNLGVIIVDEEHETSFKQDESPRYNARDLAVFRAQQENALILLGSATPSLESYYNAKHQRYGLIQLKERVLSRPLPKIECVDLRVDKERVGEGIFSVKLANAIEQTLRKNEQVILFLNRRGFAPCVLCKQCGYSFRCIDCNVGLTLHQTSGIMLCHYCGFEVVAPDVCPSCHNHRLHILGLGTQKVQKEIEALFGNVKVARLDRDTVNKRQDLTRTLQDFSEQKTQILIGTQMVAKGHDFPHVTLVGIVAGDATLNFPDFRAAERTFQLITQVSGRAGRGTKPGQVLLQAYETEHYALTTALTHQYQTFVNTELQTRQELLYPPFTHLVLIRIEGEKEQQVEEFAVKVGAHLKDRLEVGLQILGPAWAPLLRLKKMWRKQILIKAKSRKLIRSMLQTVDISPPKEIRLIVDVDPLHML